MNRVRDHMKKKSPEIRKIIRFGNSIGITFPLEILKKFDINVGCGVFIIDGGDHIRLELI